jgi:ribosomal protein S18 acetylase RimI-like enzyme
VRLRVRRANTADAALVSSLNADVQGLHAAAMPERYKPPGPQSFPPAETAALLSKENSLVFIAEIGSAPAGYAYAEMISLPETSLRYAYRMVHLHHISVRAEFRRQSAGAALLAAVRAAANEAGITLLTLDVWTFNDAARRFFTRNGFTAHTKRLASR